MIIKVLLFLKHRIPFLWKGIEFINGFLFRLFHAGKFKSASGKIFEKYRLDNFIFREIILSDLPELERLLNDQPQERIAFFNPHGFDKRQLIQLHNNPSFLMLGAFDGSQIVGYFFLRCFWNKKCFVGRLIDEPYEGKGIGRVMNQIMYNIGWQMNFRVLSTISKNNHWVMKSHAGNAAMVVRKELANDYLLVEFVRPA